MITSAWKTDHWQNSFTLATSSSSASLPIGQLPAQVSIAVQFAEDAGMIYGTSNNGIHNVATVANFIR